MIPALEFFLGGLLVGLTAAVGYRLWRIRSDISSPARHYMGRLTAFLFALSLWWVGSRLVILGFSAGNMRLNVGRSFFVVFQLWATWGLTRFLRAWHRERDDR